MIESCIKCEKRILSHAKIKFCKVCQQNCHLKCISLDKRELESIITDNNWLSTLCIGEALPFNNIEDDIQYVQTLSDKDHFDKRWDSLYDRLFNPFSLKEDELEMPLDDVDPDLNFYNDLAYHSASLCKYYSEDHFNNDIGNINLKSCQKLSMCHLNVRSMSRNFSSFTNYMQCLNYTFSFIGLTESWLTGENCTLFNLEGYDFVEKHRTSRPGGGVGLFIPDHMEYEVRNDISVNNNLIESVFIEVYKSSLDTNRNIFMGVIYRIPGSDMKEFNTLIREILDSVKSEQKLCYLIGDWNINLLNYEFHCQTAEFIDIL